MFISVLGGLANVVRSVFPVGGFVFVIIAMSVWFATRVVLYTATALLLLWVTNTVLALSPDRSYYFEKDRLDRGNNCATLPLPNLWPGTGDYDAERVAALYAQYAALSANTYSGSGFAPSRFEMKFATPAWRFHERIVGSGGLLADVYYREDWANTLHIAVAFRGTDQGWFFSWDFWDAISNFAPLTSQISPFDQYKGARDVMERVRAWAAPLVHKSRYAIVATGHSLGGGLARHVSLAFPCTAAVTFDASPVDSARDLSKAHSNQSVEIFEAGDLLPNIEHQLLGHPLRHNVTAHRQWYRMRGLEAKVPVMINDELKQMSQDQHQIVKFATAMSRMSVMCFNDTKKKVQPRVCGVRREELRIGDSIYCRAMPPRWREQDQICPPEASPIGTLAFYALSNWSNPPPRPAKLNSPK